MKGMRIFEIDEEGIKEISPDDDSKLGQAIHQSLDGMLHRSMVDYATKRVMEITGNILMEYTCKNEDKMLKYLMSFDLGGDDATADKIHSNLFRTVTRFILEYTKTLVDKCDSFEEADRLMVNAQADALEFIDQHIDKRFAEVYR